MARARLLDLKLRAIDLPGIARRVSGNHPDDAFAELRVGRRENVSHDPNTRQGDPLRASPDGIEIGAPCSDNSQVH